MTSSDRQRVVRTDALISTSEALREELLREVARLEKFVQALQAAVDLKEVRRHE